MDPRYSGRLSPPRRYAAPGRNSTGRLDTDYESYYQPRGSNHSIISGPRTSAERIVPRAEPRLGVPSRSNNDDYYVAPRYSESIHGGRRPLSIITPAGSSSRYRPAISSAADLVSSPYSSKPRGRDDESFYIQPASSSHGRHFSMGSNDIGRYASVRDRDRDRERDRERDLPVYRSNAPKHGEYLSPEVPSRDPREWDRKYEYPHRDQMYRDIPSRPRTRRVSDIDSRDRPSSAIIGSIDDYRRQQGPPPSTRGWGKMVDDDGVRREYRYPRDEPRSRESSLPRGSRDERDHVKSSRNPVTVHQDEGHSSSTDQRTRDKSHRHRRHKSINRDEESSRKDHGSDHDDRHRKSHRHRDEFEEHRGSRDIRDEGYERDDDRERSRRNDESRKSKRGDHKLAEGAAVLAATGGAGALVAEGLRHRNEREGSEVESDTAKDRSRRRRHKEESGREKDGVSDEADEDRRERRRRRRREREEKERRDRDGAEPSSDLRTEEQHDRSNRLSLVPMSSEDSRDLRSDEAEPRRSRRHGRHRRERDSSSDSDSSSDTQRVRVVSPARDASTKPKGILRPPTQKFPEDPAPIREGVAPLKNSGKKGIPPDARWTRISRKLVNPEALEFAQERYEESADTVIVLRVLTKDEIEKYALITQELRSRRAAAEQRAREDEPRAIEDKRYSDEASDSEKPKQITAQAHDEHEGREQAPAIHEIAPPTGEDEQDRPLLQKEASYQRYAPPGVQPQGNIPVYPPIPGRSSTSHSATSSPIPQVAHDPIYPSQGGTYKPSNASA